MKALEFIDQIHGVRSNGRGWKARCPAHDDREASLSIHEGDDGRILLKCFAGCETVDIVDALGLAVADLFPERLEPTNGHRPSKRIPYAIRNADGRHVATHIRIERPDGSKAFAWERPDGQSGLGGIPVTNLPLYRINRFIPNGLRI